MLERNGYLEDGVVLWAHQAGRCIGPAAKDGDLRRDYDRIAVFMAYFPPA
jgi:hypothetical protein